MKSRFYIKCRIENNFPAAVFSNERVISFKSRKCGISCEGFAGLGRDFSIVNADEAFKIKINGIEEEVAEFFGIFYADKVEKEAVIRIRNCGNIENKHVPFSEIITYQAGQYWNYL